MYSILPLQTDRQNRHSLPHYRLYTVDNTDYQVQVSDKRYLFHPYGYGPMQPGKEEAFITVKRVTLGEG